MTWDTTTRIRGRPWQPDRIVIDALAGAISGLGLPVIVYVVTAVFGAALIRGYSGFGFSALFVLSLSLVLPPAQVVPASLLLEVIASLHLLPGVWRGVPRRTLGWLIVGSAVANPIGLYLLATLPAAPMRAAASLAVLAASLLLWRDHYSGLRPSAPASLITGMVSGIANGAAAIGGLPVVLFLLATAVGAGASRALLIAYILPMDLYASAVAGMQGLITPEVTALVVLAVVPLFAGVALGKRHFIKASPESFRRFTLMLLIGLAGVGLVRAALG